MHNYKAFIASVSRETPTPVWLCKLYQYALMMTINGASFIDV